jgi:hypothetical protein
MKSTGKQGRMPYPDSAQLFIPLSADSIHQPAPLQSREMISIAISPGSEQV